MARPLRLEYPGAVWHVTSRGNERKNIFRNDADRRLLLEFLGEASKRYGWIIDTYVLMSNHYHFVIETPLPTLSRGMQWLNGSTPSASTSDTTGLAISSRAGSRAF